MRTSTPLPIWRLLAVPALTLALSPAAAQAESSNAAFCKAVVKVSNLTGSLEGPDSAVQVGKSMKAAFSGVAIPDEGRTSFAVLQTAIEKAAAGKGEALFDDALFPSLQSLGLYVFDRCGYTKFVVTSTESSFKGIPSTIKAGVVSFKNVNKGKDAHVISLWRRKAGATPKAPAVIAAATAALKAGRDPGEVISKTYDSVNGMGSFALPGQSSADTVTLVPGEYLALDPVRVGYSGVGPEPEGDVHASRGMYTVFTVR